MSRLTRSQKTRLGVFALAGGVLIIGTLVGLIGAAAMRDTTTYYVRLAGVGGLNTGAQVRYRGLSVGRVDELRITEGDVETVRVSLSIKRGTPIKVDTSAVLEMQGVTGLRFIELTGGTNDAALLPPGGTIPATGSTLDVLSASATNVAANLERITERLATLTEGITGDRVDAALDSVQSTIGALEDLVVRTADGLTSTLNGAAVLVEDLTRLSASGEVLVNETTAAVRHLRAAVDPEQVGRVLASIERAARSADRRLSEAELGQVLASIERLATRSAETVGRMDLTLIQLKDDLLRALQELVVGAEAFAEFAALLREDPSALIRGRGDKPRELD